MDLQQNPSINPAKRDGRVALAWPALTPGADFDTAHTEISFAPKLVRVPEPTSLFVRRLLCDGAIIAEDTVWSQRFDEAEQAERHHAWLLDQAANWTYWGRFATLFGPADIIGLAEKSIAAEDERRVVEEQIALAEAARAVELHNEISSYLLDRKNGTFCMSLERADARDVPLWEISFRAKGDRERFRDWFREQRHRFHEFADYLVTHTWEDLERRLLKEMLQTEVRVKKAGLGAGGTRPLRYWRGDV